MRASLSIGALAAAVLVSGAASASQVVVGKSGLVIDVEFWGRARIVSEEPGGGNNDVITYGDPVHGKFRIFGDDAPPPVAETGPSPDATSYGRISARPPTGAAFVTSRWLSPFPKGPVGNITHQGSPSARTVPDDYVVVGDRVRFSAPEPLKDWFQVSDQFSASAPNDGLSGESLTISVSSAVDFIRGNGLDQAFEIDDLQEKGDTAAGGFFRAKLDTTATAVAFFSFFVDRIRVTPHVCKP